MEWALANPVGWLDYHRIIRPAPDAYEALITGDMALNAGSTSHTYPPEALPPSRQALAIKFGDATVTDILSLRSARLIESDTNFLIWATGPATPQSAINARANVFIGAFAAPAGTDLNTYLGNLGTEYAAAQTSLATHLGEFVVLWAFEVQNGNLHFAGAWTLEIKTLAAFGTIAYWPLNEALGTRRSIAKPHDLTPIGAVTQTAGPIDTGASFTNSSVQYLTTPPSPNLHLSPADYTLSIWLNRDPAATDASILAKGSAPTAAATEFALTWASATDQYTLITSDGVVLAGVNTTLLAAPGASTWFHLAIAFDGATLTQSLYLNGTLDNTSLAPSPTNRTSDPVTVAKASLGLAQWFGLCAELTILDRELTATEITALYNAGAGLRYPYGPN